MATRGLIARTMSTGVQGRYHHWDSYPGGLGKALYALYNGHFAQDVGKMMQVLIDEHPAGWSNICDTDFELSPGFSSIDEREDSGGRPQCYCHGVRHEREQLITSLDQAERCGCEYAYVIDGFGVMTIEARLHGKWREIARVRLDGNEPNWDKLDCL